MRRAKLITLFSITGIYFFSMFQRVAVPGTIFNELQSSFLATAAQVAALGAIYLYIYGGMQLFAGMLADGIGSSRTLVAGGALLAAGSLFFPLSSSMEHLYMSRAAVGFGASLIYISMLKHIDISFSRENFPLVFSISIVAGYSGGLAGTYPFERMSGFAGWRESLMLAGIICLLFTAFAGTRLRKTLARRKNSCSAGTIGKILRNGKIFPVMASGSANFSVYFLLQATIGKKMLEDFAGLSSPSAATFTFLMMLTTMVSVLFHGFAGKRTGRRKPFSVAGASLTAAGAGIILANLLFFNSPRLFLFSYLLCSWAGGNILNATLVKETCPSGAAGTAVGIYNGAMYTSVAVTANIAGVVMDSFRHQAIETADAIVYPAAAYVAIFSGCAALGAFSVAAALRIDDPKTGSMAGTPVILEE